MIYFLIVVIILAGVVIVLQYQDLVQTRQKLNALRERVEKGEMIIQAATDLSTKTGIPFKEAVEGIQKALDDQPRRSKSSMMRFRR
jgi:predicted GTPase